MTARQTRLAAAILAFAAIAHAQAGGNPALQPLAFLGGRWVSETPSEFQEETWSPVRGDSVLGSFRVVASGKPVFYEFWAVELEGGKAVMKLKHFNSGLVGWEDKSASTRMPLVSSAENDVVFAESGGSVSLHYHRAGAVLTCTVHHIKDGQGSDEVFSLTRAAQ